MNYPSGYGPNAGYGDYGDGYNDAEPSFAEAADQSYYQTPETTSYYPESQNYDDGSPTTAIPVDQSGAVPIAVEEQSVLLPNDSPATGETPNIDGELAPGMVLPDGSTVISVGSP